MVFGNKTRSGTVGATGLSGGVDDVEGFGCELELPVACCFDRGSDNPGLASVAHLVSYVGPSRGRGTIDDPLGFFDPSPFFDPLPELSPPSRRFPPERLGSPEPLPPKKWPPEPLGAPLLASSRRGSIMSVKAWVCMACTSQRAGRWTSFGCGLPDMPAPARAKTSARVARKCRMLSSDAMKPSFLEC